MCPESRTPETADTMAADEATEEVVTLRRPPATDESLLPPTFAPERVAGRYEILSLLGAGGMGAVYKAKDLELDELIALKVLREELSSDEGAVTRFRREVKLARKVTSPNVARTFDIGEHRSHKFLTMELIDGVSLFATTENQPLMPLAQVVEVARQVCAGLGAAHAAGVVHRDLKPENILLATDGRIVLTDFGIARAIAPEGKLSGQTDGFTIGTPAYMAPEQVEGRSDIDGRADIYALGAILYELFTGVRAWDTQTLPIMAAKRLHQPAPDPRRLRPDLEPALALVTMRCMATERGDRYQTVAELVSSLAATRAASPTQGPSPHVSIATAQKTVAVLPFRNAGSPDDDYVADGLSDDLTDVLSSTEGIRVCSRGLVLARDWRSGDPRKLGQELGVQVVVDGSVRREGGRLRVTARVVSVTDGFQLWAKRFDYAESGFFEVSDAMARAVAAALTVDGDAAPRSLTTSPVALDLYLRARREYHKFWSDSLVIACGLFEQALEHAPDNPMILAGYALALMRRCAFADGTDLHAEQSRRAADRALEIAPHLASAKVARAYQRFMSGETVIAARELRETLALSPDCIDALEISGRMLAEAGAAPEGIRRIKRAIELDPSLVNSRLDLARIHALLGDRAASEAFFGEEPSQPGLSNVYWGQRSRVAAWQRDAARAKGWSAMLVARDTIASSIVRLMQAAAGEPLLPEQVKDLIASGSRQSTLVRRRAFRGVLAAEISAAHGETELTWKGLENADSAGLFDISWVDRCPLLRPLDADPRFIAFRARVAERAREVCDALGVATVGSNRLAS